MSGSDIQIEMLKAWGSAVATSFAMAGVVAVFTARTMDGWYQAPSRSPGFAWWLPASSADRGAVSSIAQAGATWPSAAWVTLAWLPMVGMAGVLSPAKSSGPSDEPAAPPIQHSYRTAGGHASAVVVPLPQPRRHRKPPSV